MRMNPKFHLYLTTILGAFVLFGTAYFVVFGRALRQNENHLGIAFSLPGAVTFGVARVDDRTYLASDREAFIARMGARGLLLKEQMGSAYFFTKGGQDYIVNSRMYSSHFMLFSHPVAQ